jgi:cell division inhibitor SepF
MSAIRNVAQGFRNLWGQGGDDDFEDDDTPSFRPPEPQPQLRHEGDDQPAQPSRYSSPPPSAERRGEPESEPQMSQPQRTEQGGGSGGSTGSRRLRPVAMPLRGREKNVYTLKPKSMDEASVAADYLKTGCAVILNLDDLSKGAALRLVDFMSGVCYGLDNQGHAMKLGETIFLFTPGDYEITSDETDYGENRDALFKEESHDAPAQPQLGAPPSQPQAPANERRSWER